MSRSVAMLLGALAATGLTGIVRADVTIEEQVNVDGFGPTKFGALEGKNVTAIAADRARTEQRSQFKSRILRALAKGSSVDTARIVRLDTELIDEIDNSSKQYSEMSFQQMRDAAAAAAAQGAQAQATEQKEAPSGAPVDESKCQWSPPKATIQQSGEHASIAGADASRATITVTTTCTDPTKGTSCDFVFLLDEWLAADLPGIAEEKQFWLDYARKLNLGGELASMRSSSQAVFRRYQGGWGEAAKQAGTLKGYPVKTSFAMQFGGPQCKDSSANSSSGAPPPSSSDSGSGSGNIPTSPSAAVGNMAMGLFNKLHKKEDTAQSASPPVAPGMVQLFGMTVETTAIRTAPIAAAAFEVPAGYAKIDKLITP